MGSRLAKLADYMYGPSGAGRGENAYLYGPQYTGRFDVLPGWRSDLASQFDDDRAVGYFRFNTGNEGRDALLSILANEFGLDNYVRAVQMQNAAGGGWQGFKDSAFKEGKGVGSVGQLGMAAFEASGVGPILKGLRYGGRGLAALPRAVRAWRGATVAAPNVSSTLGRLNLAPVITAPGAGSGLGALANVPGAPLLSAGTTMPAPLINRNANAWGTLKLGARGGPKVPPRFPPTTVRGRVAASAVRNVPRISLGATGVMAGIGMSSGKPKLTATEAAAAKAGTPGGGGPAPMGTPESPRQFTPPKSTFVPPRTTFSTTTNSTTTGTPASPAGVGGGGGGTEGLRMSVAGIQQQYNNVLRDLQSMYNKSETDFEKEQIRRILADIEAQKNAGLKALSEGYAATSAGMRTQAGDVRTQAVERGAEFGGRISGIGSGLEQRLIDQQAASAVENRGLGVGAAAVDPTNEWVNLINTLAPMQQNYTQGMGDLAAQGVDWMANTVDAQGLAQQGDLQRLAAATSAGARMSQDRRVGDRIQRETELERNAMQQILMASLDAQQRAGQFNAGLAASDRASADAAAAAQREQQMGITNTVYQLASQGRDPVFIQNYLNSIGMGQMTPEQFAIANDAWNQWRQDQLLSGVDVRNPYAPSIGSPQRGR